MNVPEGGTTRDPFDRLAESFLERFRRGERPAISEYIQNHPDHASDIRELFPRWSRSSSSSQPVRAIRPAVVARVLRFHGLAIIRSSASSAREGWGSFTRRFASRFVVVLP